MKDVVKVDSTRSNSNHVSKTTKRRRRKRNLTLYYLLIFMFVALVGIILSTTILFNVNNIQIVGDSPYDNNLILTSSEIQKGDNLVRLSSSKVSERIKSKLVYIDDVKVKKVFPEKVVITVTQAIPSANIKYSDGYVVISQSGKIIEDKLSEPKPDLMTFIGYEIKTYDLGSMAVSDKEDKQELLTELMNNISKYKIDKISEINITDKYNISLLYEGRITIEFENPNKLDYKFNFISEFFKDNHLTSTDEGTLFVRDKYVSFVSKEDLEKYENNLDSKDEDSKKENNDEQSDISEDNSIDENDLSTISENNQSE